MRFKGLDLNLLVVLEAVLSTGNVTRASERVHLSQSATSSALARLRYFFQDELLVPVGRELRPTSRALELLPIIQSLLAEVDNKIITGERFEPHTAERHIRIMASDYVMAVALSRGLEVISRLAPKLTFQISLVTATPSEAIEKFDVDLLIVPDIHASGNHPYVPYFDDDYVCMVDANNPIQESDLTLDRYLALDHVVVRFEGARVAYDDAFMKRNGYNRRMRFAVPTHSALAQFILGTDRIVTVQRRFAQVISRNIPLRILPTPFQSPRIHEVMQWNTPNAMDPTLKWFGMTLSAIEHDGFNEQDWRSYPPPAEILERAEKLVRLGKPSV